MKKNRKNNIVHIHSCIYIPFLAISLLTLIALPILMINVQISDTFRNIAISISASMLSASATGFFIDLSNAKTMENSNKRRRKELIDNLYYIIKYYYQNFINTNVDILKNAYPEKFNGTKYKINLNDMVNSNIPKIVDEKSIKNEDQSNFLNYLKQSNYYLKNIEKFLEKFLTAKDILLLDYFSKDELDGLKQISNYIATNIKSNTKTTLEKVYDTFNFIYPKLQLFSEFELNMVFVDPDNFDYKFDEPIDNVDTYLDFNKLLEEIKNGYNASI